VWSGDAPVCHPKLFYECLKPSLVDYVRNNEATNCHCPRQCRRLSYDYTISQAEFSDYLILFARDIFGLNQSENAIRYDYCRLEVSNMLADLLTVDG